MRAVILDGIVLGLQFGLLGVGMTLIYGLGGVLNLAYGQAAVLAAMVVAITLSAGAPALVAAGASEGRCAALARQSRHPFGCPSSPVRGVFFRTAQVRAQAGV